MKTIVTSKLLRKVLILAVMIVGLVFVASSDKYTQPVAALPCCENCAGEGDPGLVYSYCGVICYANPDYSACVNSCEADANACYSRCTYCSGGGGPGGECNSSSDCPINQFCAADNACHYY